MVDEGTLERLKSEHSEVFVITVDDHEIVVKMPTPAQFERFVDTSEKKPSRAMAQLVRDCLIHPAKADVDALFVRRPGIALAFGKELARLTGATLEADSKKA